MKRRTFLLSASAIGAGALTSGCVSSVGGGGSGGDGGDGGGPVRLSFACYAFQEPTIAAVEKIVSEWNSANPDIQIDYQKVDPDSVHDKLVTQFAGNAAPDIIHNEAADLSGFSKQGYLTDLGPLIPGDLKSAVPQGVWDSCTFEGKITGIPTISQMYIPIVNVTALKDAGVELPTMDSPWSWDDLFGAAEKLTKGDRSGFAWGMKQPTAGVLSMSLAFDGLWFEGDELKPSIRIGDAELKIPRYVKQMLEAKTMSASSVTLGGSDVIPGFLGDKYAMIMGANYQATDIASKAGEDFEWTMLPPLTGTNNHQTANPQTLSIARQSEHAEQAMKFIAHFMQADNLAAFGAGDALIPVTEEAADKVKEKVGAKNGWDSVLDSYEALVGAPMTKAEKYSQWKTETGNPAFQEFFGGKSDEAAMIAKLTDGWNKANA